MTVAVVGLVLAAGEGKRFGGPKALVTDHAGTTWLSRSVAALRDGGVAQVYVVVGAAAADVREAAPADCRVVEAGDWEEGMGASLRAGLGALVANDATAVQRRDRDEADGLDGASVDGSRLPDAAVVMLVDTPGVGADVVRRLAALAGPDALARAAYAGEPGHPVLLGRAHWPGVAASAAGDRGARDYLRSRDVAPVECGDIGSGDDVDTPEGLAHWRAAGGAS